MSTVKTIHHNMIACNRMLLEAQTQRLKYCLKDVYRREEHRIRDMLSHATNLDEISRVSKAALENLGIGGVNVYIFNRDSNYLKSMEREALQGGSRYEAARPIMPGEKRHFLASGTDLLLIDRASFIGLSDEDSKQAGSDLENDLEKYFGKDHAARLSVQSQLVRETLRYNLYIRYPGHDSFDMVIMANNHVKNAERVKRGETPTPIFISEIQRDIVFETLRSLQKSITSEMVKAELMRMDRLQLARASITHDLQMALDQVREHSDLFEMLLSNLPAQFMRTANKTFIHRSSILLFDEDDQLLRIAAGRGLAESVMKNTAIRTGEGIAGKVFETGKAILIPDIKTSEYYANNGDHAKVLPGSFMSVPIKFEDRIFGVMNVSSNLPKAFKPEDLQHLETLAGILASKMRLTSLMTMDGLTQVLYQRSWGVEKLQTMFKTAKKDNIALAFIIFDADHFKRINDTYSHGAGDTVLIGIANTIHRFVLSHKDLFRDHVEIRWGGEELVLGLLGISRKRAFEIAEELRVEIKSQKYLFFGEEITVTASAGIAVYPIHGSSVETLANNADKALYSAKDNSRDLVIVYDPNDQEMK